VVQALGSLVLQQETVVEKGLHSRVRLAQVGLEGKRHRANITIVGSSGAGKGLATLQCK
jgi:hypothetical protein